MDARRPREEAIPYNVPPEGAETGSRERLLAMFRDLRHGYVDMPGDWLKREDYPRDDANEVATSRFKARSRNKRRIAWTTAALNGAELAAEHFVRDPGQRSQIERFVAMLRPTIESGTPISDEQVADGDTILDLLIAALEGEAERDQAMGGAA